MRALLTVLLLPLLAGPAQADPLLGQAIPSDAFIYGHWWSRPRTGFADLYLRRVREALRSSGFVEGYIEELRADVEEKDREDFDETSRCWKRYLAAVDWWEVLSEEVAFGAVLAPGEKIQWTWLFRTGVRRRDEVLAGLRRILYALCAGFEGYEMLVGDRSGVSTSVLYSVIEPDEQLCIGGHGGVVAVTTSAHLLRRTLLLLEGEGGDFGFTTTDRYLDSRKALPDEAEPSGEREPTAGFELLFQPAGSLGQIPALRGLSRYHVMARFVPGRILWKSRLDIAAGADGLLARVYQRPGSVGDLLGKIPADVSRFEAAAGGDPEAMYDYVMSFLAMATGGPALSSLVQTLQASVGLDLVDGLLQNLTGRRLALYFAPAQPPAADGAEMPAFEGGDVYLLELRERDGSRERLGEELEKVARFLRTLGLRVDRTESAGGGVRYRAATGTLLGRELLFGLAARDLYAANSAGALDRALAAAAGQGKTLLDSPELSRAWSHPLDHLDRVSYGSLQGRLETVSSALRLLGGLARSLPREGESGLLRPILAILPRLRPAVGALDFAEREIGYSAREGSSFLGRSTTYLRRMASF